MSEALAGSALNAPDLICVRLQNELVPIEGIPNKISVPKPVDNHVEELKQDVTNSPFKTIQDTLLF